MKKIKKILKREGLKTLRKKKQNKKLKKWCQTTGLRKVPKRRGAWPAKDTP